MTEKQWYAYSTPDGINLIEGDKMPVKDFPDFWPKAKAEYEAALQAAKASGVLVQDQWNAVELIVAHDIFGPQHGTIYGPFTVGYRKRLIIYCQQMNGSGCVEKCKPIPQSHGAMDCKFKDKPYEVGRHPIRRIHQRRKKDRKIFRRLQMQLINKLRKVT